MVTGLQNSLLLIRNEVFSQKLTSSESMSVITFLITGSRFETVLLDYYWMCQPCCQQSSWLTVVMESKRVVVVISNQWTVIVWHGILCNFNYCAACCLRQYRCFTCASHRTKKKMECYVPTLFPEESSQHGSEESMIYSDSGEHLKLYGLLWEELTIGRMLPVWEDLD